MAYQKKNKSTSVYVGAIEALLGARPKNLTATSLTTPSKIREYNKDLDEWFGQLVETFRGIPPEQLEKDYRKVAEVEAERRSSKYVLKENLRTLKVVDLLKQVKSLELELNRKNLQLQRLESLFTLMEKKNRKTVKAFKDAYDALKRVPKNVWLLK